MKTNIVHEGLRLEETLDGQYRLEGFRRRPIDKNIVLEVSGGVGSSRTLFCWAPGDVGLTKIVFWRALGGAGSTKIMSWRAPGGSGSATYFFGRLYEALD